MKCGQADLLKRCNPACASPAGGYLQGYVPENGTSFSNSLASCAACLSSRISFIIALAVSLVYGLARSCLSC